MKLAIVCVGQARGAIGKSIAEYEQRLAHYYRFEVLPVKEAIHRARTVESVLREEGERLLARIPAQTEVIALHRLGSAWSSEALARHLESAALQSRPGISFLIGGAHGLAPEVLRRADRAISLSGMTLPHELARLVLTEQLYRAGTINRGEPYHKGRGG